MKKGTTNFFLVKRAGRHFGFFKRAGRHEKAAGRRALQERPRQNTDITTLIISIRIQTKYYPRYINLIKMVPCNDAT